MKKEMLNVDFNLVDQMELESPDWDLILQLQEIEIKMEVEGSTN